MTISSRIRRATMIAATAVALGFCGFAAAPAHAASIPPGSESTDNPDVIFVGDPFWTTTTPGVSAFGIPAAGCTPGCLHMWNRSPSGQVQSSSLNVTWTVNGVVTRSDRLSIQADGNFVFYNLTGGKTWAPNPTVRPYGYSATFQPDGNLVVRNSAGNAMWASKTSGYPNAFLAVQSDGNLVIYQSRTNLHALWASGTRS
jgi:hypothetical protein